MSQIVRKWFRRSLIGVLLLIILLTVATFTIVGTEAGTRWAIGKGAAIAGLDIDPGQVHGTLLSELSLSSLTFSNADLRLHVEEISLNIDWSKTSLSVFALERVDVGSISIQTFGEEQVEPSVFEVSVPELPLGFSVGRTSVDRLAVNDNELSDISLRELHSSGRKVGLSQAAAAYDKLTATVQELSVSFEGDVPVSSEIRWSLIDSTWSGDATVGGTLRKMLVQHDLFGDYPARSEGSIELLGRIAPLFDLATTAPSIRYQDWSINDANFRITGTVDDYHTELNAVTESDAAPTAMITSKADGNTTGLQSLEARVSTPIGSASVTGSLDWSPDVRTDLRLVAENINPSGFISLPAEDISGEARIVATSAENFVAEITKLSGTWNTQQSSANGRLERRDDSWSCTECRVAVGRNRIAIAGRLNSRALAGQVDIDAPALQQLWNGIAGSLVVDGSLGGTLELPRLTGGATGAGLEFAGWQADSFYLQSRDSTVENFNVEIEVTELARNDELLGSLQLRLVGPPDSIDADAKWQLDEYTASAVANVAFAEDRIDGRRLLVTMNDPFTGSWSMAGPVDFLFATDILHIGSARWVNGDAFLQHEPIDWQNGEFAVDGEIGNLPLRLVNRFLPQSVQLDGQVNATAVMSNTGGTWSGSVDWRQHNTKIVAAAANENFTVDVPVATATLRLDGNAVALRADIRAEPGFEASLDASADDLDVNAPLNAHLQFSGNEWDWITAVIPEIANLEGNVDADFRATGSIASPQLSGEAHWQQGQFVVPSLNLPLQDIDVTLSGSSAGKMTIEGQARSGKGALSIAGSVDNIASVAPTFDVRLGGEAADVINWPEYQAAVSPAISITGTMRHVQISGGVEVDNAEIAIRELAEGAVKTSDDVSVTGREEETREATRVSGDVNVALGDRFHLQAFGLDTNLEGDLRFVLREDREPQGHGEVRLTGGFFKAYGQRLEIEQGTMVFTGPLDDPLINVRATRQVEDIDGTVVAGLSLTGRATNLNSTIYSDPAMSEAEALSYLVLGRPLSQATAADGSNLTNTAYSLGLRQAALITNQIGQTVGLDELTVAGSNQNTTELIAGKQINSRLYARYAYGVFTRLGKLLLRYRLNESFSIELGAGENQSMDLLYTIEKE